MPLLKKGVLLPAKGVNYAIPATFIEDQHIFSQNMRYDKGVMRKKPGHTQVGAQAPDSNPIMGYGLLQLSSGTKHLLRASRQHIQRYNTGSSAWETISIVSYSGDNDNMFTFANVTEDDIIIATNYKEAMYKWTGSGNMALLGGSPPKAKYLAYVTPYLLAAYTDDGVSVEPWRVAWCDTNDPENWSTGNSGEALITDEPSIIQNITKLNDFAAVYKKDSLAVGVKVDTSDIFRFETIKTGVGLLAPKAFADAEGQQYFIGTNDFYRWNGIRVESIGANIREYIFGRISQSNASRCFALHVQEQTEIWFFILTTSDSWPTEIWKFNYRLGFWYYDTCSSLTAAIKWENVTSLTWGDLTGTWGQQQVTWGGYSTGSGLEEIMLGNSSGLSLSLDYTTTNELGSAVDGLIDTKDFISSEHERGGRWLKLDFWAKGPGDLYVYYSTDYGSNWTSISYTSSQTYVTLDGTMTKYEFYFDVWAEQIRFRFKNSGSNETFYLRQYTPYFLAQEEIATYRA